MTTEQNHVEIIWGVRILDEGFTTIPNLFIRNYRKLKIEHGEFGFICCLLSYKHDARDPYPSRETLAQNLGCSTRQVDKWIKSLKQKRLIRTGRRRNVHSKQWDKTVYSLKPLIDSLLMLVGDVPLPPQKEEFSIQWDDEEPSVPEVRMGSVPEVRMGSVPEVRTEKEKENNNQKDDDDSRAAAIESLFSEFQNRITKEQYETVVKRVSKYKTNNFENCLRKSVETEIHNLAVKVVKQEVQAAQQQAAAASPQPPKRRSQGSKRPAPLKVSQPATEAAQLSDEDRQALRDRIKQREARETHREPVAVAVGSDEPSF